MFKFLIFLFKKKLKKCWWISHFLEYEWGAWVQISLRLIFILKESFSVKLMVSKVIEDIETRPFPIPALRLMHDKLDSK